MGTILFIAYIYAKWEWFLCAQKWVGKWESEWGREMWYDSQCNTRIFTTKISPPLFSLACAHTSHKSIWSWILFILPFGCLFFFHLFCRSRIFIGLMFGVFLVFIVVLLSYCFVPIHVSYMWCRVYAVRCMPCMLFIYIITNNEISGEYIVIRSLYAQNGEFIIYAVFLFAGFIPWVEKSSENQFSIPLFSTITHIQHTPRTHVPSI